MLYFTKIPGLEAFAKSSNNLQRLLKVIDNVTAQFATFISLHSYYESILSSFLHIIRLFSQTIVVFLLSDFTWLGCQNSAEILGANKLERYQES